MFKFKKSKKEKCEDKCTLDRAEMRKQRDEHKRKADRFQSRFFWGFTTFFLIMTVWAVIRGDWFGVLLNFMPIGWLIIVRMEQARGNFFRDMCDSMMDALDRISDEMEREIEAETSRKEELKQKQERNLRNAPSTDRIRRKRKDGRVGSTA